MWDLGISEEFSNVNNLIFSIAISFVTKLRSKLNDQWIDDLQLKRVIFLKKVITNRTMDFNEFWNIFQYFMYLSMYFSPY